MLPPNVHKIQNIIRRRVQPPSSNLPLEKRKTKNAQRTKLISSIDRLFVTHDHSSHSRNASIKSTPALIRRRIDDARRWRRWWWWWYWYVRGCSFLWNFFRFFLSFSCSCFFPLLLIITYLHGAHVCAYSCEHDERTNAPRCYENGISNFLSSVYVFHLLLLLKLLFWGYSLSSNNIYLVIYLFIMSTALLMFISNTWLVDDQWSSCSGN